MVLEVDVVVDVVVEMLLGVLKVNLVQLQRRRTCKLVEVDLVQRRQD